MNAHADRIFARGALLILGLLFGAVVAFCVGACQAGYRPFDVALALVASTIVAEALFVVELLVTGEPLNRSDYLYLSWHRFPVTAGWILGLFASSFPQLVRHVQI
jgi:hypothetical protein